MLFNEAWYRRRETFLFSNLKETDCLKVLELYVRIILRRGLKKYDRMWTGLFCLTPGTSGGLLWARQWNCDLNNTWDRTELSAELAFSRINLPRGISYSSKEQVSNVRLLNSSVGKFRFIVGHSYCFESLGLFNNEYESVYCACLAY